MVVFLKVSSWRGISIGAIHYYAELKYDDPSKKVVNNEGYVTSSELVIVKLERILLASEVKTENLQLQQSGLSARYRAGDTTTGFITEANALDAATKYFIKHFDQTCSVLYRGEYASWSAWQNLLIWPKQHDMLAKSMTKMAQEFQALNGYECKKDKREYVERLDARWGKRYDKMNSLCSPESTDKK